MRLGGPTIISSVALTAAGVLLAATTAVAQPVPGGDVVVPATSASSLSTGSTARLDAALREAWAGLPGGAIATVIVPGRGRWIGTVGYADDERGRPMVPAMQSLVGSVTKTFTAMLVLQEVAKGGLSLDDPLTRWYPGVPKADEITIAMLLNMSSGIADYFNVLTVAPELFADPGRRYQADALISQGAALPREFEEPGSGYAYSNTNTVILGRILEKVTGRRYAALLKEGILGPLGLSRTFVDTSGDLREPHAQTYSDVYSLDPDGPRVGLTTDWSQSVFWAAGGLASTIDDLGRWGRTLGTGRGAIPAALADERLDTCAPPALETPTITMAYCLGVIAVRDRDSGRPVTLWHNGRVFGAVSYVGYYPQTGAVVAVMANSDMSGPDGDPVSMRAKAAIEAAVPRLLGLASSSPSE